MKQRNIGFAVILLGALLLTLSFVYPMAIYNSSLVTGCENLGEWYIPYTEQGVIASIDTVDRTQGSGSLRVVWGEAWPWGGYALFFGSGYDWTNTPILGVDMKISMLSSPLPYLEVQSYDWVIGQYLFATYTLSFSSTGWETKEINLATPTSGAISLGYVTSLKFWWEAVGGRTMKIDNIVIGTSSSATPTPSPTPTPFTPTPTPYNPVPSPSPSAPPTSPTPGTSPTPYNPTPTPTPTPENTSFKASLQATGIVMVAVGFFISIDDSRRKRRANA